MQIDSHAYIYIYILGTTRTSQQTQLFQQYFKTHFPFSFLHASNIYKLLNFDP